MNAYADSNFFTRLYLPIKGASEARELLEDALRGESPSLRVTWLHRIEVANALQLHVFSSRLPQQTRITAEQSAAAQAQFRDDVASSEFMRKADMSLSALESTCEELSLRHTARHGFRAYDVVHVASALLLGCDTFWSFDTKACRLASLEGLNVHAR